VAQRTLGRVRWRLVLPLVLAASAAAAGCDLGSGDEDSGERQENPGRPGPVVRHATQDNFDEVVLSRSHRRPVVVLFWAPWSAPDRVLKPIVRQAVRAREGRIEVVLVNVDELSSVAARYEVRAVPTLMPVAGGKPAFRRSVGALPRPRIDHYLDQIERRFR
jgi:thioredoxin 1